MGGSCNRRANMYARDPQYVVSDYSDPSQGLVIFLIALAVVGIVTCLVVKMMRRSSSSSGCGCGLSGRRAASGSGSMTGGKVHECSSLKDMEEIIANNDKVVVMFMAPWCSHCQSTKPQYADAAQKSATPMLMMDCDAHMKDPDALKKYNIEGFPTIQKYANGRMSGVYTGDRSSADLVTFSKAD